MRATGRRGQCGRDRNDGVGQRFPTHEPARAACHARLPTTEDTEIPAAKALSSRFVNVPVPGPWLRLTALVASAGTLLAVVSGASGLDAAHRVLAALAVPPLLAIVAAAWLTHRRLLPTSVAALACFGTAAFLTGEIVHVAAAAAAFALALVVTAQVFRSEPSTRAAWRDYVTLTKPRIMSLLLLTGFCGLVVGARGLPQWWIVVAAMAGLAFACGGASALNHVLDRDIDRLMGDPTRARPLAAERR